MIIITGATSFVGKTLIPLITKIFNKKNILCLAWNKDDETGKENKKIIEKFKLPTKEVDLVTKVGLSNLPNNPSVVIHLAANTDTSTRKHKINDSGTKNLLKALGKLGPKTHIIYTSTTVYYGGRKNCKKPLNENSHPHPTNEYSRTKLAAEKYLLKECKKQKFRLTILRLNTVYGPHPRPKSLFKLLPEQIKNGSIFTRINWPGKTSLIHVEDVAKVIMLSLTKRPKSGIPEIFIQYSESPSLAEISKLMHKSLGIKYKPVKLPIIFWKFAQVGRNITPIFEPILPQNIYNYLWRASLISDHAVWCKTNKLYKTFPKWKPIMLKDCIDDVVKE